MTATSPKRAKGRPSIALRLCRQCVEYVYQETSICPHCGGDPAAPSERFRAEGFALVEAIQNIEKARARR